MPMWQLQDTIISIEGFKDDHFAGQDLPKERIIDYDRAIRDFDEELKKIIHEIDFQRFI